VIPLFFILRSNLYGFDKKRVETHYAELVFLHLVGFSAHIVHSSASRHKMSTHYFLYLSGPDVVSIDRALGHVTLKLCFWHQSAGHVVHSSASRARKMIALIFMLGWDRYGFDEKHTGTGYTELVFCHRWELRVT
jgi:hypothetical protein